MNRLFTLFTLLFALASVDIYAHALWLETNPTGKLGQKQTVRIVYSEPGDKPEKVADWYSDVKSFELWLISPDKQRTKLTTLAGDDAYTAEFTPAKEGIYTLLIGHSAKDLGGTTKYQFNASALVTVGTSHTGNSPVVNSNELTVFTDASKTYKANQPVNLSSLFKSKPAEKIQLTVYSPSGWSKQIHTNAEGVAEFTPLWPGRYLIEASKSEKETGEQGGKPYQSVWRCATYAVNVANDK
ncbi:DUF4198 domain-containing protein [Spirosoma validum]|uniref:DUF4198 domain-containing protein n=1 Tax=Spirosoma validum TaxID=2771355 RepID=A0A927GCR2_9BACT|nr:DUF4198 domain-containing protein [Spirosoma validum]MBD2753022.1 DUF4198 domain-containing protein [Spirosoma validum]